MRGWGCAVLAAGMLCAAGVARAEPDRLGLACDVKMTVTNLPRPGFTPKPPQVLASKQNLVLNLKDHTWCYLEACAKDETPIAEINDVEIVLMRNDVRTLTVRRADSVLHDRVEMRQGEAHALLEGEGACHTAAVAAVPKP